METEGPSSSPAPEPLRDGDASASEMTREDLERRLRLSESVALELERALEGKSRSLDESTRAADALRRELRAATAANEADGSVPAAAMDAARAEIERLRAALVDGERERAALKSLASKATTKGAEGRDGGDDGRDAMNGDARLRAAVAEERLAMAERALAEWREYASALEERCAAAEAAAADAIRDARSASLRAGTETRAEALAAVPRARAKRDENPEGAREDDGGKFLPRSRTNPPAAGAAGAARARKTQRGRLARSRTRPVVSCLSEPSAVFPAVHVRGHRRVSRLEHDLSSKGFAFELLLCTSYLPLSATDDGVREALERMGIGIAFGAFRIQARSALSGDGIRRCATRVFVCVEKHTDGRRNKPTAALRHARRAP